MTKRRAISITDLPPHLRRTVEEKAPQAVAMKKKPKKATEKSTAEDKLAQDLRGLKLPEPEREHRFHPVRLWRFDFAWPDQMLACEVEGGTRSNGRHTRHEGYREDCIKYSEAALLGWRLIRATSDMVWDGTAIRLIERAFGRDA